MQVNGYDRGLSPAGQEMLVDDLLRQRRYVLVLRYRANSASAASAPSTSVVVIDSFETMAGARKRLAEFQEEPVDDFWYEVLFKADARAASSPPRASQCT